VALRLELTDHTAGFARSVDRLAPTSRLGAALLALRNDRLVEQIRSWFAPEVGTGRNGTAAAVDVLLASPSIIQLRELLGTDDVEDELTEAIVRLLDPA
jgi:hypothetical protein